MMYLIIVKAVIKMNTKKYMIIIKGEIKTRDVKFLEQDDASHKMNVTFNNRKTYSYTLDNVEFLENPKFLDPRIYHLSKDGKNFFSVEAIYEFVGKNATYIHVCFKNNVERDYYKSQLDIQESYLNKKDAANVFDYIKEISKLSNLKNEEIYLGKDIRAFTNKLFNNQLSSCYYDLFKEMQKGFNCIEVDNDDEKVLAINLAKFLCIYPYMIIVIFINLFIFQKVSNNS